MVYDGKKNVKKSPVNFGLNVTKKRKSQTSSTCFKGIKEKDN